MDKTFLLDQKEAQDFLNQNAERIFGSTAKIELISIERSKTYNPEAFNILYHIKRDSQEEDLRVSTSETLSKEPNFNVLSFLFNNGFSEKPFFVARPVAYLKPENILFYENVVGQKFADLLDQGNTRLRSLTQLFAKLARKIHSLEKPTFALFNSSKFFAEYKTELIIQNFPELENLNNVLDQIKTKLAEGKPETFCHGDFNPNNFVLNNDKIYLIDFDLSCIFYPEHDLASYLTHLRMMLNNLDKIDVFTELRQTFLSEYQYYDEERLMILMALLDLRLMEIAITYKTTGYDKYFLYKCFKDDLSKISLK